MSGSGLDMEQVAREHFMRIHRAALVLTGNRWDADDLAQETFLVFARQKHRYLGKSSLYTWLYGILLNLDRRERRRRGRARRRLRVWQSRQLAPQTDSLATADQDGLCAAWRESLWSEVAALPTVQRQALVLRFSEGLRYEEIAAILQCPVGTVKSRIFHGLLQLRRRCLRNQNLIDALG
jgi:RNA polymerase sigma-70 factor (ECF subfamily)